MHPYLQSLLGGICIGAAALTLMWRLGRVMGASGIAASALVGEKDSAWRWAFLLALIAGGALFSWLFNAQHTAVANAATLAVAGALVGVGTVLGNGCTSGHGVCGLARLSKRSLVATCVFMASGAMTVATLNALGVRG
jgi:uncharacterized protein